MHSKLEVAWKLNRNMATVATMEFRPPGRLLDLAPIESGHLKYIDSSEMKEIKCTALSHCWGTAQAKTTTRANLEEHNCQISIYDLPRTFLEASDFASCTGTVLRLSGAMAEITEIFTWIPNAFTQRTDGDSYSFNIDCRADRESDGDSLQMDGALQGLLLGIKSRRPSTDYYCLILELGHRTGTYRRVGQLTMYKSSETHDYLKIAKVVTIAIV